MACIEYCRRCQNIYFNEESCPKCGSEDFWAAYDEEVGYEEDCGYGYEDN